MNGKICIVLLAVTVLSFGSHARAQYNAPENNVWAFGVGLGLNFNHTPVRVDTTDIQHMDAAASVSDEAGNLLFYTNGMYIWDRDHDTMPGARNLASYTGTVSNRNMLVGSSSQGAIIAPIPGDPYRYYVFSLTNSYESRGPFATMPEPDYGVGALYYTEVDMRLNRGKGDVVTGRQWIRVDSNLSEKLAVVRGNDCNVWLIAHDNDTNFFKVWEITEQGIEMPATVYEVGRTGYSGVYPLGLIPGALSIYHAGTGCLAVSSDRTRIAATYTGGGLVEVYDFNANTGAISNPVVVGNAPFDTVEVLPGVLWSVAPSEFPHGLAFSPDNSKLYYNCESKLYQVDLNNPDPLSTQDSVGYVHYNAQLRLAPDGRIWFCQTGGGLGVIGEPNLAGYNCGFDPQVLPGFWIASGHMPDATIARSVHAGAVFADTLCMYTGRSLTLEAPAGFTDYEWDNGASGLQREISSSGTYWVRASRSCGEQRTDTFHAGLNYIDSPFITPFGNRLLLNAAYDGIKWFMNGDLVEALQGTDVEISENGRYYAVVSTAEGCTDTTGVYEVLNLSVPVQTAGRPGVTLYPNPAGERLFLNVSVPVSVRICAVDGKELLNERYQNGGIDVTGLAPGMYLVFVRDAADGALLHAGKLLRE